MMLAAGEIIRYLQAEKARELSDQGRSLGDVAALDLLRYRDRMDKLESLLRENKILIPPESLSTEGWAWLGSDAKSNLVDAGSLQPVLPSTVKVGQQYMLSLNLVLRQGLPSSDNVPAPAVGVAPDHTVITVLDDPVGRMGNDTMQYWARVRAAPSWKPIVYLEYATASADSAKQFAFRLGERYRISIENTVDAKGFNEVRYYFSEDAVAAKKLADDVAATLKELGYQIPGPTVRDRTKDVSAGNNPGVIDLWLDLPAK